MERCNSLFELFFIVALEGVVLIVFVVFKTEEGASLGRVLLMASLRFGHQKNASQLMAPVLSSETAAVDGTRALK